MEHIKLLRAILPDVLIDNFDVVNFEKGDTRFDIWLDEKKVLMREDKVNASVISHGFGEYHTIRDFPIATGTSWGMPGNTFSLRTTSEKT